MNEQVKTEQRTVHFEGRRIAYTLEWKAVRNLNLRIRKDGSVCVSANTSVPVSRIDEFVCSKGRYILSALNRFAETEQYRPQPKQYVNGETFNILGHGLRLEVSQGQKNEMASDGVFLRLRVRNPNDFDAKQRIVKRYLDRRCSEVFREILEERYPVLQKYGVSMPELRIRDMDTRWGSCSPKRGIITLNKRLLDAPRNCIEYVITHELCHLIHPNHSNRFYEFLTMLMPDWKARKRTLDQYAMYWL